VLCCSCISSVFEVHRKCESSSSSSPCGSATTQCKWNLLNFDRLQGGILICADDQHQVMDMRLQYFVTVSQVLPNKDHARTRES
jgi:hypothetical protein